MRSFRAPTSTGAQLQGADLSRRTVAGRRPQFGAQLQGADLSDAQLQGVDLGSAQLQGADLSGADMTDS